MPSPFIRFSSWMRPLAVLLAGMVHGVANGVGATEWDRLLSTLGNFTTRGGGPYTADLNPNEWNVAMEGGSALTAELSEPHMAMDDIYGNIYVADKNAHAIRMIKPDGTIVTVAGRHAFFSPNHGSFDGYGVATEKALSYPNGLFVFPDGTFYILETGDAGTLGRIRRVDRSGMMTTLLTDNGNNFQRGLWVSPDETFLYFCTTNRLKRWNAATPGSVTVLLDLSGVPNSDLSNIDVAQNGNIYVTDRGLHRVYSIPSSSVNLTTPVTVAGTGASDSNAINNGDLLLQGRDNVSATTIPFTEPRGIAFHPLGGYFLACHKGGDIYYIDTANIAHVAIQGGASGSTLAGEGMPITALRSTLKIAEPRSVRVGWHGDIIICTNDNGFVRVVPGICPIPKVLPQMNPQRQLSWNALAGQAYFAEKSTTLADRSWTTLLHRYPTASGPQTYTDPTPLSLQPRAFYRVFEHRKWPF